MDYSLTPQEEEEMLEMFSFEAQEMHQHLNELMLSFESNPQNKETIDEIFRIVHTLKGSAMGMNFVGISSVTHVMEDLFSELKNDTIELNKNLFNALFKACDKLGELIADIKSTGKTPVSYKGIKTKLEVILRKTKGQENTATEPAQEQTEQEEINQVAIEQVAIEQTEEILTQESSQEEIGSSQYEPLEPVAVEKSLEYVTEKNLLAHSFKTGLSSLWTGGKNLFTFSKSKHHEEQAFDPLTTEDSDQPSEIQFSSPTQDDIVQYQEDDYPQQQEEIVAESEEPTEPMYSDIPENDAETADYAVSDDPQDLLANLSEKVAVTDLVQVPIRKLDNLMNQVGQLIIERDRLMAINAANGSRNSDFASLQRITSDLQYSVMDVRLVQIGSLFNKFHRIARDVSAIENKEVQLKVHGTEVEIDRNILKTISESMVHLIRNAVGHGVESAEIRRQNHKPEIATITLSARAEKDNVVIEVQDDGKGIDAQAIRKRILDRGMVSEEFANHLTDDEIIMYIFEPGFSNAETISEISGRGVGMDVVKNAIESIGGHISLDTQVGVGTTITLNMPSSMAVKGVLLFQMADQEFAFALSYTEAVISLYKHDIHKAGIGLMSTYLKHTISVIFFSDLFHMKDFSEIYEKDMLHKTFDQLEDAAKLDVIVVSYGGKLIGVVVDKLLQQKEIIEKTIPKPLDNNKLLSGTTILGNGNVCLVVDVVAIADILYKSKLKIHETKKAS